MKREDFELLGAKHKAFEAATEQCLEPGKPVVARLDGRSFSVFTRGLERPYDARFARCMQETAAYLVEQTQAVVAYRQSDEITLVWPNQDPTKKFMFDGRVVKMATILAAMTSVRFNQLLALELPDYAAKSPLFDARVFQYPTLALAAENLLWRETDAMRNSVTNLAHEHFGHRAMHAVGVEAKLARLREAGRPWEGMPEVYRRGVYLRRETVLKSLNPEELARIPERHRPAGPVERTVVRPFDLPLLEQVANLEEVLFAGVAPIGREEGSQEKMLASVALLL
ncbi:tRNA(His) guanylyltransferase Thg1 family protein [Burkholderia ubonensis]|uniref:tRNA(His) guanylyltransferase Thg1 family protein n=1 Tax=Burkholderia ubonensis TaxID=101571 RepID=UPI00075C45B5|nr:tRNA(His) guanylyltransferase Thg1 family protein [Burkholderia ubonensis]KVP17130.1 hypothetical protein WJ84_02300 [Burkholderia ubonensis]KVP39749.1 hypothetical protein WJ87_06080 [Burkholderia ubonensis]